MQNRPGNDGHAAAGKDAVSARDERDRAADERERTADDRETAADAREQQLADWEQRLDQRDRALGVRVPSARDRAGESLARVRSRLAASRELLDRSDAAIRRADEADLRGQIEIDREAAASAWARACADDNGPGDAMAASWLTDSAEQLRKRLVATARVLAEVADRVAQYHDRLVRKDPDRSDEHQRQADDSRATAELAREIMQRSAR